jgi:hypothetical protein
MSVMATKIDRIPDNCMPIDRLFSTPIINNITRMGMMKTMKKKPNSDNNKNKYPASVKNLSSIYPY